MGIGQTAFVPSRGVNAAQLPFQLSPSVGIGTVAVQAGQWETPEEAAAFLATLTAALPAAGEAPADGATAAAGGPAVLLQEDVLVAGQPTGTATVVDAGDGTGVAVWSNGTTVFRLTGPAADIRNLYAAYPL